MPEPAPDRRRVVVDTDPGIDDAAAILLALGSDQLEVAGLTSVAGNLSLDKTTGNALRVLEFAGAAAVPVAIGADRPLVWPLALEESGSVHGPDGLGGTLRWAPSYPAAGQHAVDFLAAAAQGRPLTIVAIAPLTNIALLLARHPAVAAQLERIVIMGGARLEGNMTPAAEFNVWADPEAAARVFGSGIPITMLPLDITHQAVLTAAEVTALASGGRIGAALAGMIRYYEHQHLARYGEHFAPLHDVLAVLALIRPDLMTFVDAHVTVDCGSSPSRGATLVSTSRDPSVRPNASVGTGLDRDGFARVLIERLAALDAARRDQALREPRP